jgi:hypothetical protein
LPPTTAGQEEDDWSSSYCQALRAQTFPLALSLRSLERTEGAEGIDFFHCGGRLCRPNARPPFGGRVEWGRNENRLSLRQYLY